MIVLSHRGYWKKAAEKNTEAAFHRSFKLGFGTETDIRDRNGEIVISHDPAVEESITLENFLKIYTAYPARPTLALNIKADGLQDKLKSALAAQDIDNYFVFDMSVPDGLQYTQKLIKTFTRQSEYEKEPTFYNQAEGVWLDEFHDHWINEQVIIKHLQAGKKLCIVSPELHKRDYIGEWLEYKEIDSKINGSCLMICTDYPEKAEEFFNEKN